jgi:DNA polymerase
MVTTEERNPSYMNPLDIASVEQCTKCKNLGRDHVPSFGDPQADLMIIGQSPGFYEVQADPREPFVGEAGALLDLMLSRAELTREEVYLANALKCRPPDNRPGTQKEIRTCRDAWLKPEVKAIRPKVILALGKDATGAIGMLDYWGHGQVVKRSSFTIIISYHPAYFLRQGTEDEFVNNVGQLVRETLDGLEG